MRSRMLVFAAALTSWLTPSPALPCTAFSTDTTTGTVLAKSFDWVTGAGWMVWNEKGRSRSLLFPRGMPDDRWTSRHASLSLTTIGPGFPISGMNDVGLAIEALVDLSASPAQGSFPGQITGLEFVQYGLDRCASVEELASLSAALSVAQLAVALHFLACDPTGACIVIEPNLQGTLVTRGSELTVPVLANNPYKDDLDDFTPSVFERWFGKVQSRRSSSAGRFYTVADALRSHRVSSESDAFALLDQVALPGLTRWQLAWNLDQRILTLREKAAGVAPSTLPLAAFTQPCEGSPLVRPLGQSGARFSRWAAGDISATAEAVVLQIGGSPKERDRALRVQRLASRVAETTASSVCAPEVSR